MSDERIVKQYEADVEAIQAELQSIQLEDGTYNYPSRKAPEGYTTIRQAFRWADVHPSWLRTMLADGKFSQYDQPGMPAVLKNPRGAWAVSIAALQAYASGMRSVEPSGEPGKAGYRYEPQELKAVKRALTSAKTHKLPGTVIEELETLAAELNKAWEEGTLGKAPKAEVRKAEKEKPEEEGEEDADFEFDFSEED